MPDLIVLVPLGPVPQDLLTWLSTELPAAAGQPVQVGDQVAPPAEGFDPQRKQYEGERILARLETLHYPQETRVAGLIDADCYAPGLNFIFGQAQAGGRLCFVALPRLRPSYSGDPENPSVFYERVLKEIVHELGHTWGLEHCPDAACVMHFSNSLADTDVKGRTFCARCRERLTSTA